MYASDVAIDPFYKVTAYTGLLFGYKREHLGIN